MKKKRMIFKPSTYWICQIVGWGLYGLIAVAFAVLNGPREDLSFAFYGTILILVLGIFLTHILRLVTRKLNVLQKKILSQFIYVLASTLLFSVFFLILFNLLAIGSRGWGLIKGAFSLNSWELRIFFFQGVLFSGAFLIWNLIYFVLQYIKRTRKEEQEKTRLDIKLSEMESQALRSRMNPQFIFSCMNTIKWFIENEAKEKSIDYLTKFSKLVRTLFQNADKRQISLYDEIETCRLYIELEVMRLNGKLRYSLAIDPNLDLKSIMVPVLVIQHFIENAIWHGITPKNEGTITVSVARNSAGIICEVDDDGIGRVRSGLNKSITSLVHESSAAHLSQRGSIPGANLNGTNTMVETIDKYENGEARGTKVVLTFSLN